MAKIENQTSVMPSTVCLLVSGVVGMVWWVWCGGSGGSLELELGGTRSSKLKGNQTRLQDCGEVRANGKPKREHAYFYCVQNDWGVGLCAACLLSACVSACLPRACLAWLAIGDRW